jgi:NADH-quinone oxidoreductase subunit N
MTGLLVYLAVALILAMPLVLRVDGRYLAIATSLALLAHFAGAQLPLGLVVMAVALTLALDRPLGPFGLALAFAALATALAIIIYYAGGPTIYALIALALVTAAIYGMLAMGRVRENVEGAVKYLVFSGIGKVLMVTGYMLALCGWLQGLYIVLLGFMFELGIVPCHAWMVDAYALGSPGGVAALAALSKVTALFVLLSVFRDFAGTPGAGSVGLVALIVSLASMLVANIAGLAARTLGRIMAYSSIAHMSYALAAVALVWWLGDPGGRVEFLGARLGVADLAALVVMLEALSAGLAKAGVFGYLTAAFADAGAPGKSALNTLNVLSLLGLPPLLGFWPKLFLVLLIVAYPSLPLAVFLVSWVVLNSAAATPYYLRALRMVAEAPGRVADNFTSACTAALSTALGIAMPLTVSALLAGL